MYNVTVKATVFNRYFDLKMQFRGTVDVYCYGIQPMYFDFNDPMSRNH